MSSQNIRLSIDGHVATICLENPEKHNALAAQDIAHFVSLLNEVETDKDIRALLITSSGGKTFCAGASLTELGGGSLNGEGFEVLTNRIAATAIPTICAINGNAYGGGAEIGLCCDFRIGFKEMRMFIPATRFGLCYPVNGIQRYVHKLGPDTAKRLLVASEELNGEDLLAVGYLTHITEKDNVQAKAIAMAQAISQLAPIATRTMKAICDQTASGNLDLEETTTLIQQCNQSNDLQEGLIEKKEKRTPVFKGN